MFVLTEQDGTRRFGFSLRVLPVDIYRRVDSPPRARVAVAVLMSKYGPALAQLYVCPPWPHALRADPRPIWPTQYSSH